MQLPSLSRHSRPSRATARALLLALVASLTTAAASVAAAGEVPGLRLSSSGMASSTTYLVMADGTILFGISELGEGRSLDGDGDLDDHVAAVFDPVAGTVTQLGVGFSDTAPDAPNRPVALPGGGAGFLVYEDGRFDFDGDGDLYDSVLHLYRAGTVVNTGVSVRPAGIEALDDGRIAAASPSVPGFNGPVLAIYDPVTRQVEHHELWVEPFTADAQGRPIVAVPGGALAVQVLESRQWQDYNGDGDRDDVATIVVDAAGAEHTLPSATYPVAGVTGHVAVTVEEEMAGRDLNRDGDLADGILHVWSPVTRTMRSTGLAVFELEPGWRDEVVRLGDGFAVGVDVSRDGEAPVLHRIDVDGTVQELPVVTATVLALPTPTGDLYVEQLSVSNGSFVAEAAHVDGGTNAVSPSDMPVEPGWASFTRPAADGTVVFGTVAQAGDELRMAVMHPDGHVTRTDTPMSLEGLFVATGVGDGRAVAASPAAHRNDGDPGGIALVDTLAGGAVALPVTAAAQLGSLTPVPGVGVAMLVDEAVATDEDETRWSGSRRVSRNADTDAKDLVLAVLVVDDTPDTTAPSVADPTWPLRGASGSRLPDVFLQGESEYLLSTVDDRGRGDRPVSAVVTFDGEVTDVLPSFDLIGAEARELYYAPVAAPTALGPHEMCVVGSDAAGNAASACRTVWVDDGEGPVVVHEAPAGAIEVGVPVTLRATLSDTTRVTKASASVDARAKAVEVVDGAFGTDTVTVAFTTTFETAGTHRVCVSGHDGRWYSGLPCTELVVDDGLAPVLDSLTATDVTGDGWIDVGEDVRIVADVRDGGRVDSIELWLDGVGPTAMALTEPGGGLARGTVVTSFAEPGTHEACVVARDTDGHSSTPACTDVVVDAMLAPVIDQLALAAEPITQGDPIVVSVTATDDARVASATARIGSWVIALPRTTGADDGTTATFVGSFQTTVMDPGPREVCVDVVDDRGLQVTACGVVTVADGNGPTTSMQLDPSLGDVETLYVGDRLQRAGRSLGAVSEHTTGRSVIAGAQLLVDGVAVAELVAGDGAFDEIAEAVALPTDLRIDTAGEHEICLVARDVLGNVTAKPSCVVVTLTPYVVSANGTFSGTGTAVGEIGVGGGSFDVELTADGAAVGEDATGHLVFRETYFTFEATTFRDFTVDTTGGAHVVGEGLVNGTFPCAYEAFLNDGEQHTSGGPLSEDRFTIDLRACTGFSGAAQRHEVPDEGDVVVPRRNWWLSPPYL